MSNAAKHKKKAAEFELQKQFDKAVASYVRAIEVSDADGEEVDVALLNKVGDLTLRLGRVAEAVASYERAVEHYAAHGLHNNAIALCNKILRHAPGRVGVYLTLGRVCARKGMRGDATRNFLEYATRMKQEGRADEAMRSLAEVAGLMPELEEVRRLVEEHAERAGVTLPATAAAPERASGDGLVFLEIDYDAPIVLTPPRGAAALPPRSTPQRPVVPAPSAASSRGSSLEDFLIFDPTEEEPPALAPVLEGLETATEPPASAPAPAEGFEPTTLEVPDAPAIDAGPGDASGRDGEAPAAADPVESTATPDGLTDALGFAPMVDREAAAVPSLEGLLSDDGQPAVDEAASDVASELVWVAEADSSPVEAMPVEELPLGERLVEELLVEELLVEEPLVNVSIVDLTLVDEAAIATDVLGMELVGQEPLDEPRLDDGLLDAEVAADAVLDAERLDEVVFDLEAIEASASEVADAAEPAEDAAVEALASVEAPVTTEQADELPYLAVTPASERAVVDASPVASREALDHEPPTIDEPLASDAPDTIEEPFPIDTPDAVEEPRAADEPLALAEPPALDGDVSDEPVALELVWLDSDVPEPLLEVPPTDLLVTPVDGLVFVALDTPVDPIAGLVIETDSEPMSATDDDRADVTSLADGTEEFAAIDASAEEADATAGAELDGVPGTHAWSSTPEGLLVEESAMEAGSEDDVLAGVVPLRGVQFDAGSASLVPPRPARPIARLNPHDFILPGELPPIRIPDALLAVGRGAAAAVADRPADDVRTGAEPAEPAAITVETGEVGDESALLATDIADAETPAVSDAPVDHEPAERADASASPEDAAPVALEGELEGALMRAFSGAYEAIADEVAAAERAALESPRGTSAIVQLVIERCRRLREEVAEHPGDWARRRRLAEALLEAGKREEGLEELAATALGLEVEGALIEAARVIDDLIRIAPERVAHHQKRVELAVRLGDRERLRESYLDLADALVRGGQAHRAEPVYARVLELDPWDDRARAALGDAAPPPPAARPQPAAKADDGYVNLADWLADDAGPRDTRMRMEAPTVTGDEDADFDRLLQHFREGVARSLGDDDYESHYDLGVAYKEMGLLDDAIAEFQRALRSPAHRSPAYEALGQCFLEQGSFPVAVTVLSRALHEPGLDDVQRVGVLYLLGYACEALQRRDEARSYYQRVYATDHSFRDVAERLAALDRGER